MEKAARERMRRVDSWPAGVESCVANAKKMFFRGNELKDVLEIKELAFFWIRNELVFERKIRRSMPKNRHKLEFCGPVSCLFGRRGGGVISLPIADFGLSNERTGIGVWRSTWARLIPAFGFLLLMLARSSSGASEPIQ